MSESSMWAVLRDHIFVGAAVDAERVENRLGSGFPDVVWTAYGETGLLELKEEDDWPLKGGTLRVPHYTKEQLLFARRWGNSHGAIHLLLKVARDWLLFEGITATFFVGLSDKQVLFDGCMESWTGRPPRKEFLRVLTSAREIPTVKPW